MCFHTTQASYLAYAGQGVKIQGPNKNTGLDLHRQTDPQRVLYTHKIHTYTQTFHLGRPEGILCRERDLNLESTFFEWRQFLTTNVNQVNQMN